MIFWMIWTLLWKSVQFRVMFWQFKVIFGLFWGDYVVIFYYVWCDFAWFWTFKGILSNFDWILGNFVHFFLETLYVFLLLQFWQQYKKMAIMADFCGCFDWFCPFLEVLLGDLGQFLGLGNFSHFWPIFAIFGQYLAILANCLAILAVFWAILAIFVWYFWAILANLGQF